MFTTVFVGEQRPKIAYIKKDQNIFFKTKKEFQKNFNEIQRLEKKE